MGRILLDLTQQIKGEDVATVVIPLGARMSEVDENYQGTDSEERLTIAGVNDGRDYLEDEEAVALYGRIVKVVIHEDVTEESLSSQCPGTGIWKNPPGSCPLLR